MLPSETWREITRSRVRDVAREYPQFVPAKLHELEKLRLETVPEALQRRKNEGKSFLEKDELLGLVEWKLKHGTFRPNLMKLVSSNSENSIETSTAEAYAACEDKDITKSLAFLTKLSGIGPATASLVLSVYDPANVPFFSDELFRYVNLEVNDSSKLSGWNKKIGYTKREFDIIYERVGQLRTRLNETEDDGDSVTALDLEKVAYVLARSGSDAAAKDTPPKRSRVHESSLRIGGDALEPDATGSDQRYPTRKKSKTVK